VAEETSAVDRELSAVAAAVRERLPELTQEIWQGLMRSMPELHGDDVYDKLLDASIAENVETLLNVFQHGTAIEDVHAPAAAHEYARSLARREIPIVALGRTYRLGHGLFLARCTEEIAARHYDSDMTAALVARVVPMGFDYIDRVSEQVILTYQRERDNWLLAQAAGHAARVRALLADNPSDLSAAEAALGYRLRGKHIGVVAWFSGVPAGEKGLAELERLASAAARVLEARGRPLFVPRDEARAWIWLPLPADAEITRDLLEVAFDDGNSPVRVTVGEPAVGLDGFRLTHDQAVRTQNLALVASPGARVTTFAEVGALALICSDHDAARLWVLATLNDLAIDDESHARLRETLLVYLTTGSDTVTAERMMLHKNTAQYRVGRAEEALGRPIGERRADVELALRACHHLGRAVLRDAVQSAR
jgi:DNA-binding PucR family transcriptional regulator